MDVLSAALILWNAGDRTTLDVELAGNNATQTIDELTQALAEIRLSIELEQRSRRDAQYAMDINARYAAMVDELQNGHPPHTVDSDDAMLGPYADPVEAGRVARPGERRLS